MGNQWRDLPINYINEPYCPATVPNDYGSSASALSCQRMQLPTRPRYETNPLSEPYLLTYFHQTGSSQAPSLLSSLLSLTPTQPSVQQNTEITWNVWGQLSLSLSRDTTNLPTRSHLPTDSSWLSSLTELGHSLVSSIHYTENLDLTYLSTDICSFSGAEALVVRTVLYRRPRSRASFLQNHHESETLSVL